MTKQELVKAMAEKTGDSQTSQEKALVAFQEVVKETLAKGEKIQLVGFGSFEITERKPRMGRNPKTNEEMPIPGGKAPKFKAGKQLKEAVIG